MYRSIEDGERLASSCNGMINYMLHSPLAFSHRAVGKTCDLLLPGIGGELFRAFFFRTDSPRPTSTRQVAREMASLLRVNRRMKPVARQGCVDAMSLVEDSLLSELDAAGIQEPELALDWLYLNQRVANFTSDAVLLGSGRMRVYEPWLYTPVLEVAPSVPFEKKKRDLVHRFIVERNSSALARIILSNGETVGSAGIPIALRAQSHWYRGRDLARKVINRASREEIAREVVRPNYQYDYSALLASRHGELVRNTLRVDDMVLGKLVD